MVSDFIFKVRKSNYIPVEEISFLGSAGIAYIIYICCLVYLFLFCFPLFCLFVFVLTNQ